MFVTSPFGMRTDPMDAGKQQMHKGIDIRCKGYAVLATENNGKVVAVNHNANTAGGKSITIEYPRSDGSKVQNTYMHLSSVDVKVGDTVKKGQVLGIIEAMKLMNEIESEYDGVVEAILVNNEDVVEYNQPLFRIR